MPKQFSNGKNKKLLSEYSIDEIIHVITKRGFSDQQIASFLYETYSKFAKDYDAGGRTTLHLAASLGRSELCQWLICNEAKINAKDFESGYTPLQRAIFHGHILTAVRLLQMGSDEMILDKEGLTAIDCIVKDRPKQVEISLNVPCQVYIWGSNDNYTLGTGTNNSRKVPDLLDNFGMKNISIKQICMDEFHSIFVSSCSKVYVCGNAQGGRLGIPTERLVLTPKILGIGTEQCHMAAIALNHSLILLTNGTILACGQNEHYQLGISPYMKECSRLKPVIFKQEHELITGVCAGKYHSVFYGKTCIFTCGLNGGQLGHPFSESSPFIRVPSQVPVNLKSGSYITHVASSSACITFSTSSGDIYILYQFQFKKIASKQLDVIQIATAGGSLKTKSINDSFGVLKVVLLSSGGTIQIWQETVPHFIRCKFGLSRLISIKYIFLNESQILFTTKDGEAFRGSIGQIEKQTISSPQKEKSGFHKFIENSECYQVSVNRIAHVHRAVSITSDPRGKNLAVIQAHPLNAVTDIPVQNRKCATFDEQFMQLFEESSEMDSLHDIIFKVKKELFPAHEYVIACNASSFLTLPRQGKVIDIPDVEPEIFREILNFMYTGSCSFFGNESTNFCLTNPKDDPVKMILEACSKYKITLLLKCIVCFKYENGCIKLKDSSKKPTSVRCKLGRNIFPELYDVQVASEDGKLFKAHKCVLAARLDYFHSMLMGGWRETVNTPVLRLDCPSKQLEALLDFLYTNEISDSFQADGFDCLGRLLIISDHLLFSDLKEYCEVSLVNCLNLKNAATMLQLSFLYNSPQLRNTVMQFISLNLETILESRSLEELSDEILLELDKYHKQFNSSVFDRRIITPYSDFTIPDDAILSCSPIQWPDQFIYTYEKDKISKDNNNKLLQKNSQPISKKKTTTPKKPHNIVQAEQTVPQEIEVPIEKEITIVASSSPPEPEPVFNSFDFPTLGCNKGLTTSTTRNHSKISPEPRKVFPPRMCQKQRKRISLELDEKKEKILEEPSIPKPRFKGWAIISPPVPNEDNFERNEQSSPPQTSNFVEIIASEQQERNNLFKMKSKPFTLTQLEDKAMEDLYEFYNASNIFDERITVQRVLSPNVAKPTWIKTNKTLFH